MPPPKGVMKPPAVRKQRAKGGEKLTGTQMVVIGVVGALLAACGTGVYILRKSKSIRLSVDDTAALKGVFLSGQPWLVECTTGSPSDAMYKAESKLKAPLLPGLLDCDRKLPSGKTTVERFGLKAPHQGPFILAIANLEKPVVAPRNVVEDADALAKWATMVTKPRVLAMSSSAQLEKSCLKKRWCVLVLAAGSRLSDIERKALSTISSSERGVRFVTVDHAKQSLLLDLPGGLATPSAQQSTVLLLKQLAPPANEGNAKASIKSPNAVKVLIHGLNDAAETVSSIRVAFDDAADVPEGFHILDKRPMLKAVEVDKPKPKPAAQASSKDSSRTLTDAELKALREERKAEAERLKREAEQQRREEMAAEEASAGNIVEEVPALMDDDDEDSDMEDEEETVEAVELDDD